MAKKYIFPQNNSIKNTDELFNELYFNSLEETQKTDEYKENSKKIDLYKRILKNNYNVNSNIIDNLISLVEENIELEYEKAIENIKKNI